MIIRRAEVHDQEALIALMTHYLVEFFHRPDPGHAALQAYITRLLDNPYEGIQWVAEADGRVAGFTTLLFTYSTLRLQRIAILNDLFVLPEFRGRKIGEALFGACREAASQYGCAFLQWETTADNMVAQALYDKMGGERSPLWTYTLEIQTSG